MYIFILSWGDKTMYFSAFSEIDKSNYIFFKNLEIVFGNPQGIFFHV